MARPSTITRNGSPNPCPRHPRAAPLVLASRRLCARTSWTGLSRRVSAFVKKTSPNDSGAADYRFVKPCGCSPPKDWSRPSRTRALAFRSSIRAIQQRIEQGVDVAEFLILDREFHMATYTGCTDEHLMSSVTRLWNATQHYRRAFMSVSGPGRAWIVNAEHRLLMEAIERQDADDAELYLLGHIRRTRKELARHPEIFSMGS